LPAQYYSEIAAASRAMGMDIKDDDYDKINALLDSKCEDADDADLLVDGFLPMPPNGELLVN
jgi:hypothetical protein